MNMEALVILGMFGPTEIIIIVLIVVLLFGGRKIPELMKGIGQGMKEFKKATKDEPKKDDSKPEAELDK
jgi:sec-independent protein translocase protein TatA